ncbi:MAG TPA: APC family permease [Gaiellaceae bacterium]
MTSTAADAPGGSRDLFVRNATGLVRELSAFDAFNLVFSAVLIPVGITQVMGFTPQFWPHANMLLSFAIATPLVLCFGLVYLYFTTLMPRSGGDYVWVSRTLHPLLGFVVNFSLTFVFLTWVAFNFTFMLSVVGPGAAYVAGIHNHWFVSPTKNEMMLISTLLTAAFAGLMVFGVRSVARYMAVTFAIVWLGMLAWIVAMLVGGHEHFVHAWNASSGTTYDSIINTAQKYGFNAGGGIAWTATLFAMVYCFQVYTGFQWTGYFAGEIKNARRTAVTSILGGLAASAVIYMVAVGLIYKYYGFKFFGSLVWLGLGGGTAHYHLAFSPYLASMANFLPGPHVIQIFIALCFVLAILWWTPTGFMLGTRNVFAWSFDRLAPTKLTDVSDRFHTPVMATVFVALVVELLNYLNIYQGLGAYLLNIIAVMGGAFIIVSIAAAVTPWRRKDLHAAAPAWAARKIAGVPVITLLAVVSGAAWAFVIWTAFHTGFGGTLGWKPMVKAFSAPVIAVIWYLVVWAYRRSQGIDLSKTFHEIPPE